MNYKLTDERIENILRAVDPRTQRLPYGWRKFAVAVESAATAPLLAEIDQLKAALAEARKALQACKPYLENSYRTTSTRAMVDAALKGTP